MTVELSNHTGLQSCECSACTGFNDLDDASLDQQAGGFANGKQIWTPDQIAAYLNRTSGQWGDGFNDMMPRGGDKNVITYGFHENQQSLFDNGYVYSQNGGLFGLAEYFQFAAFTTAQRDATRKAMDYWDDVLAVTFVETSAYQGDINFGNLTNSPNTQAYSRIPTTGLATTLGGQVAGIAGDIWVSTAQASNFQFGPGGYGMNTLTHEIGHSLGLSHPGNYNFGPGFAVNYINGAEYAQDARNYTIMSYWNPRDMGSTATGVPTRDFDWSLMNIAYGATPMIHDILAAQAMYGADMTTRTGDTVYGFNSTAGRDAFDFTKTAWPTMTIWDAGGIDTLDASGYGVTQLIDLTPGSLSSIGGITAAEAATQLSFAQVNANRAAAGMAPVAQATYDANMAAFYADPEWRGRLTDNVGIAYGTIIENAKGGSGSDTIYGNSANNVLEGNAGDDILEGREGDDTLIGGTGNDLMKGGLGNDLYFVDSAGDVVLELAGEGHDTVSSSISYTLGDHVEDLILTGTAKNGTGNGLDNTITGNAMSNHLNGGAGNDRLIGGDGVDFLTGGAGNDVFVAEINATKVASKQGPISLDVVLDFTRGQDKIDLSGIDANTLQAGHQAFKFVGNAAGKNAGELSIQRFGNMNAAEKALGMELDGYDGDSPFSGPVTVLLGNVDGGDYDFAMVFVDTPNLTSSDFLF